jgi:chromate transporter
MDQDMRPPSTSAPPQVSLGTIFWIFFQIGSLSVGGGLTAWLYREIVENRKLMSEADFMGALTLAQVLPGINMANLSVYVGQRLRGVEGAVVAMVGLTLVPFFAIIAIGSVYAQLKTQPLLHHFLDGLAATAVGLLLAMTLKAIKVTRMDLVQLGIVGVVVLLVGVLRLPMVPVIIVVAPISIALAWIRLTRETADKTGSGSGKGSGDA